MSHFKIGEWGKFRSEFQRLLPNFPIIDLYDVWMSVLNNYITIDIITFGNRLKKMYPEEWEYMSMRGIIVKHYGVEAMRLIELTL